MPNKPSKFGNLVRTVTFAGSLVLSQPAFGQNKSVDYTKEVVDSPEEYRQLLDAIRKVETGSFKNSAEAVGDNGKALGPYQIHEEYWQDAVDYDKTIGGKYEDVKNKEYAEKIVRAYWKRYAPKTATFEQLAAIHNGGNKALRPERWSKTAEYRRKVLNNLKK